MLTKEQYLAKRKDLIAKAELLLAENKIEESSRVQEEIKNLDTGFENAVKAQKNIDALKDSAIVVDLENKSVTNLNPVEKTTTAAKNTEEKDVYKNAFAKHLMGRALDKNEQQIFDKVNLDVKNTALDAGTNAVLIPETVRDGIWKEMGELHPILNDLVMNFVPGDFTITKETNKGAKAKFYDEATATEDGTVAFGEVNLTGCELSRAVPVKWKLKKMTPDAFIAYIQSNIAERMADGLAYGIVEGLGKPGAEDTFKPEPLGVATALEAEAQTPQVVTYNDTTDEFDYKKMTSIMKRMKSGYAAGACFYATNDFIWDVLANITDEMGRPIFVADTTGEGVGRVFGKLVKEEDAVPANALLLGNIAKGYVCNANEDITMYQQDRVKDRETDYVGYSLVDGSPMTTKAFVYAKKEVTESSSS